MNIQDKSALELFAERLNALAGLAEEDIRAIAGLSGRVIQVRANTDIISRGEHAEHASLVVEGLIGRFFQLRDGKRQITAIHVPGDMADLHAVATPMIASPIQALTTTTLIRIPHGELRRVAKNNPAITSAFWAYSAVDAAILAQWTVNVGRRSATSRLAHLLCELALRMELAGRGVPASFALEATQAQLGDALSLTSVHVNRTFKELRAMNLVAVNGRTVEIANWSGLARIADFDPRYLRLSTLEERAA